MFIEPFIICESYFLSVIVIGCQGRVSTSFLKTSVILRRGEVCQRLSIDGPIMRLDSLGRNDECIEAIACLAFPSDGLLDQSVVRVARPAHVHRPMQPHKIPLMNLCIPLTCKGMIKVQTYPFQQRECMEKLC